MGDSGTNFTYDLYTNKPTYAYTAETTEFDDACIARGIITKADAIRRKGATVSEAIRLAAEDDVKQQERSGDHGKNENDAKVDKEEDDDDDERFLKNYRSQRIRELKEESSIILGGGKRKRIFGSVVHISRPDWNREVNDESRDGQWVVINLTCDSVWEARQVEVALSRLAEKFDFIKFISIKSTSAIEGWPDQNLPAVFVYRFGVLQKQMIGLEAFGGAGINCDRIEWRLAKLGVVRTKFTSDPPRSKFDRSLEIDNDSNFLSHGMAKLTTQDDDLDSYDDVD